METGGNKRGGLQRTCDKPMRSDYGLPMHDSQAILRARGDVTVYATDGGTRINADRRKKKMDFHPLRSSASICGSLSLFSDL